MRFPQVHSAEVKQRAAAAKFNIRPSILGQPFIRFHPLPSKFPTILLVHRINCNNNQVESSPTSSVPSKSSVSSTDTSASGRPESWRPSDSGGRQTESDSSSGGELTSHELNLATISGVSLPSLAILDQSCSSLPSQSAASSGSSQEQVSNLTHRSFWKVQKNQPIFDFLT